MLKCILSKERLLLGNKQVFPSNIVVMVGNLDESLKIRHLLWMMD